MHPKPPEGVMRPAILALFLTLAAAPAAAQTPQPAAPTNPAARLLAHRAELNLTADQVRRLEEIDRRASQQTLALRTRLEAVRGVPAGQPLRLREMTPEQRQEMAAKRGEIEPLMLQLRAVHAQTAADARGVLTLEQSDQARRLMYAGPAMGAGRGPNRGGDRGWAPRRGRGPGPQWGRRPGWRPWGRWDEAAAPGS
jgi:hypothetical protein